MSIAIHDEMSDDSKQRPLRRRPAGRRQRPLTVGVCLRLLCFVIALHPSVLQSDPVAVRFAEGSLHGFLVIHGLDRKVIAAGDLIRTIQQNRVKSHLVFRFRDGSIDDETAFFSQRGHFRLLSDRHIQRGPSFPNPTDVSINVSAGLVTVRYEEKGLKKTYREHLDLPPDLANGLILGAC